MKHEKISIKWKIFFYLLVFTGILLTVLWLVQICYLDKFYKKIKSQEALELTSEVIAVLQSDSQNIEEQIDALAAQNNMIVFVTDTDGNTIYSAEYIPNSRLCEMPQEMIQKLYEAAKSKGGSTKLEFEGDIGKNDFQNPQDVMNPDATGEGNISDAADVAGAGAENAPDAAAGATGAGNSRMQPMWQGREQKMPQVQPTAQSRRLRGCRRRTVLCRTTDRNGLRASFT
ncbi:MAG: hypothetical protein ACLTIG_02505 [Roseburia hominis]